MLNRQIDYRPLLDPVTREQVKRFKRTAATASPSSSVWIVVMMVFLFGIVGAIMLGQFVTLLNATGTAQGGFLAFPIILVVVMVIGGFIAAAANRSRWEKNFRLHTFAEANGMRHVINGGGAMYPGVIFQSGSGRTTTNRFTGVNGNAFDIANYTYTTGSGKNRSTHRWAYLVIPLTRSLPHILLDAKANNLLFGSNLPLRFDKEQILRLEGDFNEFFTLYCPRGYEADALYIFTPDVMALMIDHTSAFDVEIIDRNMYVYATSHFDFGSAALWARLFTIIDLVGGKTEYQTQRYRDDRVGDAAANIVAPQGQRLRQSFPWVPVAIGIAVFAVWILVGVLR